MPRKSYKLDSIIGGMQALQFGDQLKNTYDQAVGIDPDAPGNTNISSRTGGIISPVLYGQFSSTEISGAPMWITTTPKNALTYAYCADGKFVSYSSAFTSAASTSIGTVSSSSGNGMAYYNNYIYLASNTGIFRFGPVNNSPTLSATNFWGTTLGFTALNNWTTPSVRNVTFPNHAMKVHTDGFLYICDVIDSAYATTGVRGKGVVHRISTKSDGTTEGISNNGSAYDVLELPFGYNPIAIESYGTDLAVVAVYSATGDQSINQGRAALFLWDTFASIPYKQIQIPDPIVSGVFSNNGNLYVFSGNASAGFRISQYDGADSLPQVAFFESGFAPLQGAIDAYEDKMFFGSFSTYLGSSDGYGVVYSFRSKNSSLPNVLNCPVVTSNTGTLPIVSSIKVAQQADNSRPRVIVGWKDGSGVGLDKYGQAGGQNIRSQFKLFLPFEKPASLIAIRVLLDRAVDATSSITPVVYVDDASQTISTLGVINNTNYSGKTTIVYKRPELSVVAQENIILNFAWANTTSIGIREIEIIWDEFNVIKTV